MLVTGHTGFKGSWLCLWLQTLGRGSRPGWRSRRIRQPSHFSLLGMNLDDRRCDVRDAGRRAGYRARTAAPELVIHLAAQPLVRESYAEPLATWSTNVMGTANGAGGLPRMAPSVRAVVVATTDKCYENDRPRRRLCAKATGWAATIPYSASKAAAELVAASYRAAFFSTAGRAR